jgi:hypothetical protein
MPLDLANKTPFACQQMPLVDEKGATILVIVLKGAYELDPEGALRIADEQPRIVMEDEFWGEAGLSSLRYESDVTFGKPRTDLIVNGQASARNRRRVQAVDVELRYQRRVVKRLRVCGDRRWEKGVFGWRLTKPEPFKEIPIVYERAFGGSDERGSEARNRIGTGYATSLSSEFNGTPAPNVEFPDQLIRGPKNRPAPAGLGAVSRNWEPRLLFAGTYDDAWLEERFPLLPVDFDRKFNQSTPADQWIDRPRGGESIEIRGMTPDGVLRMEIPSCEMDLTLVYNNKIKKNSMDLDTVLVEPDNSRLTLTWRGVADIHGDPFRLKEMIVSSPPGSK